MLSQEFKDFYRNWMRKAHSYKAQNIHSAFDRFLTLYIIYNRQYAEVTFRLERQGHLRVANRNSFPDRKAATDYVSQYLGAKNLLQSIESDPTCVEAIQDVIALLTGPVSGHQFHIKLDKIDGSLQRHEDLKLLRRIRSKSACEKVGGLLDFIYSVRCNLVHAHKGFEPVQIEVIRPATELLTKIIVVLYEHLDRHP
jgi:hypothetical protein